MCRPSRPGLPGRVAPGDGMNTKPFDWEKVGVWAAWVTLAWWGVSWLLGMG